MNLVIGAVGGAIIGGAMAYITGGNVWAGAAGGAVEGTLLASGVGAIFAGVAGSATQTLIETGGNMDAMDVAGIGMGAVSVPGGGGATRGVVKNVAREVEENAERNLLKSKLNDYVPDMYENVAKGLTRDEYNELSGLALRDRHARIGMKCHDDMGNMARVELNIPYTSRGKPGPDFDLRDQGYWFDLSTKNTWSSKPGKYGPGGAPIYYDPGEVMKYYERNFLK